MTHTTTAAHDPVDALVLDLLAWLGADGRPYAEVMAAWRTSCPRLPVWEEANLHGLIEQGSRPGEGRATHRRRPKWHRPVPRQANLASVRALAASISRRRPPRTACAPAT